MKEPLVLLPGMMCDARLFGPQITAFSDEHSVTVAPVCDHDTITEIAAHVLRSAPPRFSLAGLSLGGIVAMEVYRQAPDRILRLALLDTNPKAESTAVAQSREPQIEKIRKGQLRTVMRDELVPFYLTKGPNTARIANLCMAMAEALGPDVFERQSRALQTRPDQQETLRSMRIPTLILCGEDDRLCPLHRHLLMHDLIPHATLAVIKQAGHMPTLEQPEPTNKALATWLNTER